MPRLTAKSLKVTCVLDPTEIDAIDPTVTPRVVLNITVQDLGNVTGDISAKSVRRAQAQIAEHSVDGVACVLQGRLASGGRITEAGLVCQIKAPKMQMETAA